MACMGMMHQIMIRSTFDYKNNEGSDKWDLRLVRYTSSGENDNDCDEVEKVVIDQGCNQWFKINWLLVSRKDSA